MKPSLKSLFLLFMLGGVTACGDALVDATYTGEPRYVLSGEVKSLAPSSQKGTTRVILAWDNWVRNGDIISFQSVELASRNPPFDYELRLMDDPPTEALNDFVGRGLLGMAYVIVYEDVNQDGSPGDEEPQRGIAPGHIVLFAPEVTPSLLGILQDWGGIINLEDLKPGYNLARGVCVDDETYDLLRIVPNEPVPVNTTEDEGMVSCLNFH